MATAYISEYAELAEDSNGNVIQAAKEPSVTTQTVSFTTTTQSTAFNTRTTYITISADAECHISVATSPTATTSTRQLQADTELTLGVVAGDKIAFVTA